MISETTSFVALDGLFRLLGRKWDMAILAALTARSLHWTELRAEVHRYHKKTCGGGDSTLHDSILSRALRRMQRDGLILRVEEAAVFPRSVTYALTPAAECLIEKLAPVAEWAMIHIGSSERRAVTVTSTPDGTT
ncbi:winged helix-turn-helix transcriptional regulator [Saccharothrix syringae]|uniref:Transcriptional regulator n=1 Tax=Saccharothrix syringae TaxID=103733 RepID=A0A5Q0GX24_SACSY|nr:winged helix-turn-helix transcriptional regulator [Saccharothrix syringae]QFZ18481.1 transcriptional regulator [Saccharothrix syringae]